MEWMGYGLAILMGGSLGIIGGGGSILTVPILVYFFSQSPLEATTGSLAVVGSTAFLGAIMKGREGEIDYGTGFSFALPSFLGVFFVRRLVLPEIPNDIGGLVSKDALVLISFALIMTIAARAMIRPRAIQPHISDKNWSEIAFKGFFVGMITGFVGAGGGFLIIPALVLLVGLPMRKAVGTSLAIIAANAMFGFFISPNKESVDLSVLIPITMLGLLGMMAGHAQSSRFDEARLKKGFGYFVLIIGSLIVVEQLLRLAHLR